MSLNSAIILQLSLLVENDTGTSRHLSRIWRTAAGLGADLVPPEAAWTANNSLCVSLLVVFPSYGFSPPPDSLAMSLPHPLLSISATFVAWKSLILLIAWLAPGQGYDTSTSLLFGANRLVRWDAIYFVQKAQRGDVFEQEWAFGKGLSTLLSGIAGHEISAITTTGIVVSHLTHYLSVVLLWAVAVSLSMTTRLGHDTSVIPFIASCLHIISPAGIFLSAPYGEAPFSCLNMLGFWLYLQAHISPDSSVTRKCCALIMSVASFGFATTIRSNGILSGLPFLFDAVTLSLKT